MPSEARFRRLVNVGESGLPLLLVPGTEVQGLFFSSSEKEATFI